MSSFQQPIGHCIWQWSLSTMTYISSFPFISTTTISFKKCILLKYAWMLSPYSRVWLFVTLWTIACQSPLYTSQAGILERFACPPPGDLPDPGIEPASPVSPALQVDSLPLSHWGSPQMLYWQYNHWALFYNKSWRFTAEKMFWLEDKMYIGQIQHDESLCYIKFLTLMISFFDLCLFPYLF